jgi:hypothetical protein
VGEPYRNVSKVLDARVDVVTALGLGMRVKTSHSKEDVAYQNHHDELRSFAHLLRNSGTRQLDAEKLNCWSSFKRRRLTLNWSAMRPWPFSQKTKGVGVSLIPRRK